MRKEPTLALVPWTHELYSAALDEGHNPEKLVRVKAEDRTLLATALWEQGLSPAEAVARLVEALEETRS